MMMWMMTLTYKITEMMIQLLYKGPNLQCPVSTPLTSGNSSINNSSGGSSRKMQSLGSIYEATSLVQMNFDYSLICLMDECDPVVFE